MDILRLVRPTEALDALAKDYIDEHRLYGEEELHGGAMLEKLPYPAWLKLIRENNDPATVHAEWVVADTFFAVREADGRIVGMADIRHTLNDFLAEYGGHIGFGVRPNERCKGYAAEILRLSLAHAKHAVNLRRVMLACYKDNEGSRRTILHGGGTLEREFVHTDGKTIQVFWIEL